MLKVMLIDDEQFALKELQLQLADMETIRVVGLFTNPYEGFFKIRSLEPDVIFLDIDMPETSGIYLAEQIVNTFDDIRIIFVTAHDEYAIRAFELHAMDYILKPFSSERIQKSIMWAEKSKKSGNKDRINALSENYEESIKKFLVSNGEDYLILDLDDIYYIEAINKETKIHTKDHHYISKHPLKYYENKLINMNFYRAHKSFLINLDKVVRISPRINYSFDIHFKYIKDSVPISRNSGRVLKQFLEL